MNFCKHSSTAKIQKVSAGIFFLLLMANMMGCGQKSASNPGPPVVTEAVDSLAGIILDASNPDKKRQALVQTHVDKAPALVKAMTKDLTPGTEEEYDRIPWIWRVSIALGERNNAEEIQQLLMVSLPQNDEPLRDWQAVVVGGGVINGISRQGKWPKQRIEDILGADDELLARWKRALKLSSRMTDNPQVANPTRYDALRMIAMESWDKRGEQLVSYLTEEVDSELQMGAISGLSDMQAPQVPEVLVAYFDEYSTDRNKELALEALMRTDQRKTALLDAVANGRISKSDVGNDRVERLKSASNATVRKQAQQLFS